MSTLNAEAIHAGLHTQIVGRTLRTYGQVGSTNDLVKQAARSGHDEGLIVLAEEQRAGRGRMGRGWIAPPGQNLLLSLLLRPALALPDVFVLTMLAGVALCEAVEQVVSVPVALKWPNDLLLSVGTAQGPSLRKAAGILCEVEPENGRVAWAIVGMGINVNWSPSGEVDGRDLSLTATSLSAAAGHTIDRLMLLRALIERLDGRYQALTASRQAELFTDWRGRLAMLGQVVEVRLFDRTIHGVAEDVEPSGALLVRETGGGLQRVVAGDVG